MATSQTERLNAFARSLGFRNYYDYRNFLARRMGYASYNEQRRARQTGSGLKGEDASNPRYTGRARQPRPVPRPPRIIADAPRVDRNLVRRINSIDPKTLAGPNVLRVNQLWARLYDRQLQVAAAGTRLLGGPGLGKRQSEMNGILKDMAGSAFDFFGDPLANIYKEAALAANPGWKPSQADVARLTELQKAGRQAITQATGFTQQDIARTLRELKGMSKKGPDERARWAEKHGIRSRRYSDGQRHSFGHYATLVMNASAARAANLGVLHSSESRIFEVVDGPGCGWTSHDDTEHANGKIVDQDEAEDYPIAHPNCQRKFIPRPDLERERDERRAKRAARAVTAGRIAAGGAAAAGVTALALNHDLRVKVAQTAVRAIGPAKQVLHRVDTWLRNLNVNRQAVQAVSRQAALDDIAAWEEEAFDGIQTPEYVRRMVGARQVELPKVVGDEFGWLSQYRERQLVAQSSVADIVTRQNLERAAFETMNRATGGSVGGRVARFTFPRTGFVRRRGTLRKLATTPPEEFDPEAFLKTMLQRKERSARLAVEPNRFAQATATLTQRGLVNHLSFNRHGLIRAGITRDPETGLWTQNLRLVPRGPIRVVAKVNRSRGRRVFWKDVASSDRQGLLGMKYGETRRVGNFLWERLSENEYIRGRAQVTSVSWEVRLLTKLPVNFSARFNTNLRALGVNSWQDVFRLRRNQFQVMLNSDQKFFEVVSLTANMRLRGWGPLQLAKAFRLDQEQMQKLWATSTRFMQETMPDKLADLVAERRRRHIFAVPDLPEGT